MKQVLQAYASYNHWANKEITSAILEMDENLHQQIVKSSFPNLYATVLHIWDAESIWLQRMKQHQQILVPSKEFNPTMQEAVNGWLEQSYQLIHYVQSLTDEDLMKEFDYKNLKGQAFRSPYWQTVHHVFNHSTYHRGQLVTMMRELGVTVLPVTDFIYWCRVTGI